VCGSLATCSGLHACNDNFCISPRTPTLFTGNGCLQVVIERFLQDIAVAACMGYGTNVSEAAHLARLSKQRTH
jgi:hypothetical protein